jgi:taurine dioxygenase
MHVEVCPKVGCKISGLELLSATRTETAQLQALLYQHKLVQISGQELSESEFCRVSGMFGDPVPYLQSNYHHPAYPLIFVSSNVKSQGKALGVARTGGYWHSDTSFLESPVPLTLLYPRVVPRDTRRTTLFIDLEQAYRELPEPLKRRTAGRTFVHSGKWRFKVRAEDVGLDLTEILGMIHQAQPPVKHPAVIRHPVTGSEILYATRGFTIGVDGLGTDESAQLLQELFDFIEQERFISEFQWQLGDVILWDNRFFAHKAGRLETVNDPVRGNIAAEEETLVYRIIIRDSFPLSLDVGLSETGNFRPGSVKTRNCA